MIERRSRKKMKSKNKRKKIAWIVLIVLLVVGAGGYLFRKPLAVMAFDLFLSGKVEQTLERSYSPIEGEEPRPLEPVEEKMKPFSTLLLGVDQRNNEPARSDTMIYAVVRPEDAKVLLISIPRDTYTEIVGKGKEDKINHAYAFGGEKMAKDTVENFIGYPVDYYAAVNFQGVRDIVDALGGVELPITKDIVNKQADHEKFTIKANKPLYDGTEALNFVRYREDSDFNRTKRHQVFLNAMVNRMLKLNQVTKIPELINLMGDNFKTDLPPSQIIELSKKVLLGDTSPQISGFTILGKGIRINGVYYDKANEEDVDFAKEMIDNWLNPDTEAFELILPESRDAEKTDAGQNGAQGTAANTSKNE
ncbi:LCP family protein [Paenibacillus barengoltzii]|jgi:LCP family protein required for cell wall assembly|uniref:LCP family protein n=1 Tax=Paenibacillus barengoltzii TaxID=343517 RepID=UPI000A085003|nr:LCP family protein [Paenibacillus barengoltzii]SMF21299.1 transcriptional attenuator, LytR family [Paenibacillus barengoltzii]